ncbi:hypothetical protein CKO28_20305 [Rhodovibrio sodomensis]|uniref:AMP-dependent synthetase/ligase domain-containing protein n=1 Tax=Rhodovibrio sodomensis TaxID=1088 RepID=A0ABS1DLV5_9PROT|nr:fatty acyl-AMP ligase [Rhodovibrio sodomensis]MBK1670370.1 hypothetical protein [Rhodovibrio sodomensis]
MRQPQESHAVANEPLPATPASGAPGVTPTSDPSLAHRPADFASLTEALDYAAGGETGLNFYDRRGRVATVVSYAALRRRALGVARGLLAQGLERGERVALVAEMAPAFAVGFFACQYAGLHAVPVPAQAGLGNSAGYVDGLRRILVSARARIVLGGEGDLEPLKAAVAGLQVGRVTTVAALLDEAGSGPGEGALQPLGPAEISHVQYSSGSTRDPVGIQIDQRGLMANAERAVRDALAIGADDRAVSWLPFYHDMGLIGFLAMPVTCQMSVDYLAPEAFALRPTLWLELISANRGTVAFSPTFGYELCTRRARGLKELDLSSWRIAGVGGERVRPETLEAFAATFAPAGFHVTAFTPSYGLAEATLAVSFHATRHAPAVDTVDATALMRDGEARPVSAGDTAQACRFVACGRPLTDHQVQIRDSAGRRLAERAVGRIFVAGPSLMRGYVDNDATSAGAPQPDGWPDGWLDTGDLGYLADGALYVTGRRKDLIIVNGRNIPPQDLEWVAQQAVDRLSDRDTAAFSVLDSAGRETPVLLAQIRARDPQVRKRLRERIQAALFQSLAITCRVILVPPRSLPFTSSGKLSRTKARELYLSGSLGNAGPAATAGE